MLRKIIDLSKRKVKGMQTVIKIDQNKIVFDSLNGTFKYFYEPVPNSTLIENPSWLGYEVKNTINSDSLNERHEYEINKPQNVFRIISLGDSYTYGLYVNTPENYSGTARGFA